MGISVGMFFKTQLFHPWLHPSSFPPNQFSLSLVPCTGDWYPSVSQGFLPLKENVLKVCLLFTTVAPLLSITISQVLLRHSSNWSHWLSCSFSPLILHSAARGLFMISLLLPPPPSFTAAPRTLPPAKVSFQCLLLFPGLHRHCSFTWNSFFVTLTHFAILSPSSLFGLSLVILSSRKYALTRVFITSMFQNCGYLVTLYPSLYHKMWGQSQFTQWLFYLVPATLFAWNIVGAQ